MRLSGPSRRWMALTSRRLSSTRFRDRRSSQRNGLAAARRSRGRRGVPSQARERSSAGRRPLQLRERPSRIRRERRQSVPDGVRYDIEIQPVVGVSQTIPHAADVAPRLVWRELGRTRAQTMRGFTDPFQAALNGVARLSVALERLPVHAGQIGFDPLGVLDDVGQGVRLIVFRRHGADRDRCWP